jgi:hypothetical protein
MYDGFFVFRPSFIIFHSVMWLMSYNLFERYLLCSIYVLIIKAGQSPELEWHGCTKFHASPSMAQRCLGSSFDSRFC